MLPVSDAWKEKQEQLLVPETFVEIECVITEDGLQEKAIGTGTDEEIFSNASAITEEVDFKEGHKFATFESNLWVLDGSRKIYDGTEENIGYVCDVDNFTNGCSVTLTLDTVHEQAIPGITIVWSSEYNEYARSFTVTAKNGANIVNEITISDNKSVESVVSLDIENYDSVTVTVHTWSMPHRRPRIDFIRLGSIIKFGKKELLSFSHEQTGCPFSGELPKKCVDFTIDNRDQRWNPSNPQGLEKYLSERQRLIVRYGMDIDGTTEWTRVGTFYLSEWNAPSNGLEASFSARDVFEFMLDVPYKGIKTGTYEEIFNAAITQANLPSEVTVLVEPPVAAWYNTKIELTEDYTIAEVIQLCANANAMLIHLDNVGGINLSEYNWGIFKNTEYELPLKIEYSYPEIELSKKLKEVVASYGEDSEYVVPVESTGETQTIDNPLIVDKNNAAWLAETVAEILKSRKTVSGEYRADPRLELFDQISVETKFGTISPVLITNAKFTYTGAFKGTYKGRVLEVGNG